MKIRLNKFLSSCGLGSRRKTEELIKNGEIKINRQVTTKLSSTVNPDIDKVEYRGSILSQVSEFYYIILNKPKGYVTTQFDEKMRPIVMDMIPDTYKRAGVTPVGRLDMDTQGILLLTNNGDLAFRLSHPSYGIEKEYLVDIDKPLSESDMKKMEKGVYLHQIKKKTGKAVVKPIDIEKKRLKFRISEGKKRQVRHTFENLGYRVITLTRTAYGPLSIRGLKRGAYRSLKKNEVRSLLELVKLQGHS